MTNKKQCLVCGNEIAPYRTYCSKVCVGKGLWLPDPWRHFRKKGGDK